MIVTLDGQRVDETFTPGCTLQSLIDQIRGAPPLAERLIVSVSVNGERLTETRLEDGLLQPITGDDHVDLETSQPDELVHNALIGLAEQFGTAAEPLESLADRLGGAEPTAAVRGVGDFIALWQTCYRALSQCSGLIGRDLTQFTHRDRTVQQWLETLIDKLNELKAALESRDMVMLADILRYEMPPLAETWEQLLTNVARQVRSTPA